MGGRKERGPGSLQAQAIRFLCCVLLPFSILSTILGLRTIRSLREQYERSVSALLDSCTDQLQHRIDTSDYLLLNLSTENASFLGFIQEGADWHHTLYRNNLYKDMNRAIVLSGSADGLFVRTGAGETVNSRRVRYKGAEELSQEEIGELLAASLLEDGKWHLVKGGKGNFLVHILSGPNYRLGAYINADTVLTPLLADLLEAGAEISIAEGEPEGEQRGLRITSELSSRHIRLSLEVPAMSVYGNALAWTGISAALLVLSVLMIPLIILAFRQKIGLPLQSLQRAFHELEEGNEDYRITEEASSRDFGDTFQSFNTMASNLTALQKQVLEEQEHRHELTVHNLSLRLENLQLQIRPHFLQNTMNLLFTLIHNGQSENAERLVLYLSRYFRYMFRHGHDLELFDREMEMVKEYLAISELHYENAFTVSYQIDPVLSFLRIPPLLLHNFVENIIQHALAPGRTVHIIIYGEYDDERGEAVLQVADDGNGIPADFAEMINRNDFSGVPEGKHIGIRNSINRLQYCCGERAGVSVETEMGVGTTFTIRIPCDLSDDDAAGERSLER